MSPLIVALVFNARPVAQSPGYFDIGPRVHYATCLVIIKADDPEYEDELESRLQCGGVRAGETEGD